MHSEADTQLLGHALAERQALMVPMVLTELLSDPKLGLALRELLVNVPMVEIKTGYWRMAGELRALVLRQKQKARLGDALIAQTCVDRGVRLLTRDWDYPRFVEAAGLDLAVKKRERAGHGVEAGA